MAARGWDQRIVLIVVALALGGILRIAASQSLIGDLGAWLPWLNRPRVTLYFADLEGRYLVPVSRPMSSSVDLPRMALEELIRGPKADANLQGTVPPETTLRSLDIRDGTAHVDLSKAFLAGLAEDDVVQAVTVVEKTLTALPEVEGVILTVEDRPLQMADFRPAPAGETMVTLYFVYGSYLVPVSQSLPEGRSYPRRALEAYLQGPQSDGPLIGLPPGTKLLDFDFNPDNGLAYVNLTYTQDVRALATLEPERVRLILTAIIFTLTEFSEVQAVMLDFEGHAQLGLGQCRDLLRTAQLRPDVLNDERTIGP